MEHLSLQATYPNLLAQMKAEGYAPHSIRIVEVMVKELLALSTSPNEQTYAEYECYLHKKHQGSSIRSYISTLNKIKNFNLHGIITKPYQQVPHDSAYEKLNSYYADLVKQYQNIAQSRGLKPNSISSISGQTSVFFLYLQSCGINNLSEVSEDVIVSFFKQGQFGNRGYCTMSHIRSMLGMLSTYAIHKCFDIDRVRNLLPKFPRRRKIYNYLTKEDINKIREVLSDQSNALSLRDKAIGRLAFYTGIRTSDLANLRIDNIDWNMSIIKFQMKKTGNEIVIPLTAHVGNAIYEYITKERGFFDNPIVFLLGKKWPKPLSRGNLYHISIRILSAAGVYDERKHGGFHLFRHHFGTALLEKEVDGSVISSLMGHNSIASTHCYYDIDIVHLKECALSIEPFPVNIK